MKCNMEMPVRRRVLLLFSGGMDSTILLRALIERGHNHVECLLIDYGQRHIVELSYAVKYCVKMGVTFHQRTLAMPQDNCLTDKNEPLNGKEQDHDFVVPYRNMIFIAHACSLAKQVGCDVVCFGANQDDAAAFTDCGEPFIEAINKASCFCAGVSVVAPFARLGKREIMTRVANLFVPSFDADDSYSCYGGGKPCGWCGACKKRNEALASLV